MYNFHVFCIFVISVASQKGLLCIMFKILTVVLQYLKDVFSHFCILAEKKMKLKSWVLTSC